MKLLSSIAIRYLLARKRQSIVSLLGIILGVAFFLAISSLMRGTETDFIRRLVDNSPHINITPEFRLPREQPAVITYPDRLVEIRNVKPVNETRGILNYNQVIESLKFSNPDIVASPTLNDQAIIRGAGRNYSVTLSGMIPEDIKKVTTVEKYMVEGTVDNIISNPDGVIIGANLAKNLSLYMGNNLTLTSSTGQVRNFKIVGMFRTGRSQYDERQAFVTLKRVQALTDRANRTSNILVKLSDPYQAKEIADDIESRIGYKAVSWQEASEDMISSLVVRNIVMYTVVSAVLVVAAFGIYNVISTVVIEKHKDISILKSMGFRASDIKNIFVTQGLVLGVIGCLVGIPLGCVLMFSLSQVSLKAPGSSEAIPMPVDWGITQFLIAIAFALGSASIAALLPARKAAIVEPVDILRGS